MNGLHAVTKLSAIYLPKPTERFREYHSHAFLFYFFLFYSFGPDILFLFSFFIHLRLLLLGRFFEEIQDIDLRLSNLYQYKLLLLFLFKRMCIYYFAWLFPFFSILFYIHILNVNYEVYRM